MTDVAHTTKTQVTNPHIKRVYCAYHHSFNMLRGVPPIATWEENTEFSALLRRLVDEHGVWHVESDI